MKQEKKRPHEREFVETDERKFYLKYDGGFGHYVDMEFSQLDLLQIMNHLKYRNERIHEKFMKIIREADKMTGLKTDFTRSLPKRRLNVKF